MLGQLLYRFVHTSSVRLNSVVPKASLSELRKRTGYSFINCKKALLQFDNDLDKAEEWLHAEAQKQGWQKAEKLKGRETKQGLIGYRKFGNVATIVEINCETDFAAKSSHFKDLMNDVLIICHNHAADKELSDSLIKLNINPPELNSLPWQEVKTLADRLALSVVKIGENLNARRALCVKYKDDIIVSGYAHPTNHGFDDNSIQIGKYVGLVMYRRLSDSPILPEFNKSLCQHIIGMNPKIIGEMETIQESVEETQNKLTEESTKEKVEDSSTSSSSSDENSSSDESSSSDDENISEMFEETDLVKQKFISDPDKTVGEILNEASIQILDFVRFECGQQLDQEKIEE